MLNPGGWDNQLIHKRNRGTGAVIYQAVFTIPGFDLAGKGNVVDRAGSHFMIGHIGDAADRDAIVG